MTLKGLGSPAALASVVVMRAARGAVISLLAGLAALSASAFLPPAGRTVKYMESGVGFTGFELGHR